MSDTTPRFIALDIHAQPLADGMPHLITRDTRTGLEWTDATASISRPHAEAMAACEAVTIAGGGWRAPTREELLSIVDISRFDPAVDPEAFPFVKPSWYWSSDAAAWSSASAWGVSFGYGDVYYSPRSSNGFALAVRRAGQ
ncbi:MAG: DUF1566 domain-containing protein [Lysobacter sp.]